MVDTQVRQASISKFINAYSDLGINIYAVHVQNEPNSCQNFPSCIWTPTSLSTFIGDYLGPRFVEDKILNKNCIISRTGYTGEDGFELYISPKDTITVWNKLLGQPFGLKPAGLGARDTLRIEACYSLYGHELNETTSPIESNVGFVVKDKETGILTEPKNADELSLKIKYLFKNKDEAERLGKQAQERVEAEFKWSVIVEKISELYKTL